MSTPLELVSFEAQRSHIVIVLNPGLQDQSWGDVEGASTQAMAEIESREKPACIVDLSPLKYMGSSMVALVVKMWKGIRARDGRMVVICNHPFVKEVLQLAALDKVWTIVPDRASAFKQLKIRDTVTPPAPAVTNGNPPAASVVTSAEANSGPASNQGWAWLIAGLFLLAGAGVILGLGSKLAVEQQIRLAALITLSGMALVCSLITLAWRQGVQRILAILVTLACFGIAIGGVMTPPPVVEQETTAEDVQESASDGQTESPETAPESGDVPSDAT